MTPRKLLRAAPVIHFTTTPCRPQRRAWAFWSRRSTALQVRRIGGYLQSAQWDSRSDPHSERAHGRAHLGPARADAGCSPCNSCGIAPNAEGLARGQGDSTAAVRYRRTKGGTGRHGCE